MTHKIKGHFAFNECFSVQDESLRGQRQKHRAAVTVPPWKQFFTSTVLLSPLHILLDYKSLPSGRCGTVANGIIPVAAVSVSVLPPIGYFGVVSRSNGATLVYFSF